MTDRISTVDIMDVIMLIIVQVIQSVKTYCGLS